MAIEGPLRELGIHDVFQLLDLSRKTGVLRVSSELRHNSGSVYFQDGAVIFATIHSNPHLLGAMLVRSGKITEADLDRARDMQTRGDRRRLGQVLIAIGVITPRDVERQVRFQVEEVVFEMMSWREGFFSFSEEPGTDVPAEAAVRIPTEALLMEGARRIDEWSRIEKRVPHLGIVATLAPPPEPGAGAGTLDLLPAEWEVLTLVDGTRDVRATAQDLGRSEFEVAKTLFGLESAGVVALHDPGPVGADPASAAQLVELTARVEDALTRREFEEARAAAERASTASPHEGGAHLLLGRVHLAAARPGEAADAFRRALRLDPLLVAAHRLLGHALAAAGRFGEAVEAWNQWEKLAQNSDSELARRPDVERARTAAQTLAAVRGVSAGIDG